MMATILVTALSVTFIKDTLAVPFFTLVVIVYLLPTVRRGTRIVLNSAKVASTEASAVPEACITPFGSTVNVTPFLVYDEP